MNVRKEIKKEIRKDRRVLFCLLVFCVICMTAAGCGKKQEDGLVILSGERTEESLSEQETAGKGNSGLSEDDMSGQADLPEEDAGGETDTPKEMLFAYVCGAVNHPGVYQLPADSRIYEAIDAAGGLRGDAAGEFVNQAQKLEDGQRIYVPTREETQQASDLWNVDVSETGEKQNVSGKVNINSATAEELKTLPGIGDAKAQSIVSYRQQNGLFQSIEELMNVEGIKDGVFDKIKDKITV